jgi:hypothetical protein
MHLIEMEDILFAVFYSIITWNNFTFTERLYHFAVEEGFHRSADYIERINIGIVNYLNSHHKAIFDYCKFTLASTFVLFMDFAPSAIKPVLNVLFGGVKQY